MTKKSLLSIYGSRRFARPEYDGPERRVAERRLIRDRRAGSLLTRDPQRFGRRSGQDRRSRG